MRKRRPCQNIGVPSTDSYNPFVVVDDGINPLLLNVFLLKVDDRDDTEEEVDLVERAIAESSEEIDEVEDMYCRFWTREREYA